MLLDAVNSEAAVKAAAAQARQILQNEPHYVPALMVAGVADEWAGDYKGAQDAYNQALAALPMFAPAERQLVILDARHFQNDAAGYTLAEKARAAYPDDPEVAKSLGILSYYQGNFSRSAEVLQECIEEGQNSAEVYYYLGMAYYGLKENGQSKPALEKALALNVSGRLADEARRTLAQLK
jgi:Flp pilus assembly protein TadD